MLASLDAFVVRHRRPILAATAAVMTGLAIAIMVPAGGAAWLVRSALAVGLFAVMFAVWSIGRSRPDGLVVDPQRRVFRVAPAASEVYHTVAFAFFPALMIPMLSPSTWPQWAVSLLLVVPVGARFVATWRGPHLHLRPDGIEERIVSRTLFVPWEALATGHPRRPSLHAAHLKLRYTQRGLVRQRGFGFPKRLFIDTVHPWFIADVVRHYAGHPEHRAAIGTPEEYHRLRAGLAADTEPAYPDNP